MFNDYWKHDWVIPVYRSEGLEPLLATFAENAIVPAEGGIDLPGIVSDGFTTDPDPNVIVLGVSTKPPP
jgi:hypothetical protein